MTRPRIPGQVTAGALALALALAFWPDDAIAAVCPATDEVQLTAGRTIDAGDVKVSADARYGTRDTDRIYVKRPLEHDKG